MTEVKLYLNEHLSPTIAKSLQARGYDCITPHDVGMLTKSDEEQMVFAVSQNRTVVTFNIADFQKLHQEYIYSDREHFGIIISTEVPVPIVINRLLNLLRKMSSDELKNQIRWLNEFK